MSHGEVHETTTILLQSFDRAGNLSRDLEGALHSWSHVVVVSSQDAELPALVERAAEGARTPVVAVLVLATPIAEGLRTVIRSLRSRSPQLSLVIATDDRSSERMIELLELGVVDFVTPPFRDIDVRPRLWRLIDHAREGDHLVRSLAEGIGLKRLVGRSPAFMAAVERIPPIAGCDATVLLRGETGTGKEVFARAIHYLSPRRRRPFIPINGGAIPVDLIENELFGHERSAFTGASTRRRGLIREAEGGTLFLDEVDCLPLAAQIKLLRFLQEKEYRPLGSAKSHRADVRLIAATNSDLEEKLRAGQFRKDLFYRLNVLPLMLPPLRDRHEDIPLLARHFLAESAGELGKPTPRPSPKALQALLLHDWPGNVRELKHLMQRAVVFAGRHTTIRRADFQLPSTPKAVGFRSFREAKARVVEKFERGYIEELLLVHEGNICRAARAAKKDRRAFWELIRKHRIDAARFRSGG